MKATDLRVGNYYKWTDKNHNFKDCDVYQIESISSISLIEEYFKYFEPILLTEEWLLKFGFVELQYEDQTFGFKLNDFWFINETQIRNKYNSMLLDVEIKYVHQLQNLYFALTKNELTLNKTIEK